jgi:light-regulated signal transduction histidine kinase (bacteriophytochrome)
MKSRFISMASHEFRTPRAVILSSSELIKDYGNRMPPSDQQEVIGTIENGVQRMTQMRDGVLLLGKAEAHMLEFQPRQIAFQPTKSRVCSNRFTVPATWATSREPGWDWRLSRMRWTCMAARSPSAARRDKVRASG